MSHSQAIFFEVGFIICIFKMRNERLMEIKCKVIEQAHGRAGVTTKALVLNYYVIVLFSLDLSFLICSMGGRQNAHSLWNVSHAFSSVLPV